MDVLQSLSRDLPWDHPMTLARVHCDIQVRNNQIIFASLVF